MSPRDLDALLACNCKPIVGQQVFVVAVEKKDGIRVAFTRDSAGICQTAETLANDLRCLPGLSSV